MKERAGPEKMKLGIERLEDVLVVWVDSLDEKDLLVADDRGIFFTTPHWNGYRAVELEVVLRTADPITNESDAV